MTASPLKSSITLLTTDRHQSSLHPIITLNNNPLPLNKTPKILGLTYDTHMTFSPHIDQITSSTKWKLNILRTFSQHNFSDRKHTLTTTYKQLLRTNINYASHAWFPALSKSNTKKLQITQNTALRIITGCAKTTPIQHLHDETYILPIPTHLKMVGTQFFSENTQSNPSMPPNTLQPPPYIN